MNVLINIYQENQRIIHYIVFKIQYLYSYHMKINLFEFMIQIVN